MLSGSRPPPPLHPATLAARRVIDHPSNNFLELIKIAGLNPYRGDLRFSNWSGIDFSGQDLRGFDFTGANLSNCRFDDALIEGARFDVANVKSANITGAADWVNHFFAWTRTSQALSMQHLPDGAVIMDSPLCPALTVGTIEELPSRYDDRKTGYKRRVGMSRRVTIGEYALMSSWSGAVESHTITSIMNDLDALADRRYDPYQFDDNELRSYLELLHNYSGYEYTPPYVISNFYTSVNTKIVYAIDSTELHSYRELEWCIHESNELDRSYVPASPDNIFQHSVFSFVPYSSSIKSSQSYNVRVSRLLST